MRSNDTDIETVFAEAKLWPAEVAAVRAILKSTPLTEQLKWGSPCYTWQGHNIAILWEMKSGCVLGFFKGVLLKDPHNLLELPGKNSRSSMMLRFTDLADIAAKTHAVLGLLHEAMANAEAGLKVDLPKDDLDYPEELIAALEADPDLATAFEALTPGRRRGYLLIFSEPKQAKTREARIEKHRARILAGKGMHDR
ncbi:MAG: uncharacterized protein JWS10_4236 [Cypionkella sp.]|uniref:YdeI/OmpD-associated family protein n=1 Tax=Cypionkella sp. TaxID=2811411 RepID=UPI0026287781|nr:YdeI/OmpD-associated family protein [Cypionkella sp.]MDB5661621.1 uncharacterized protein [Cypionkella sp.]